MVYTIYKTLVLLKNQLADCIFEFFFKNYNRLSFCFIFFEEIGFFHNIIMESLNVIKEYIIKDIRNLFRQKKN